MWQRKMEKFRVISADNQFNKSVSVTKKTLFCLTTNRKRLQVAKKSYSLTEKILSSFYLL